MLPLALLELLIASQCLVLPLFLLRRGRWRQPSPLALTVLLGLLAVSTAVGAVQRLGGAPSRFPTSLFGLLYGPAIWGFVRGLAFPQRPWRRRDLLHLAPFGAVSLALASGHDSTSARIALTAASLWYYLGATLVVRADYRRTLRSTRTAAPRERVIWIDFAALGYLGLNLLDSGTVVAARWTSSIDPVPLRAAFFVVLLGYVAGFVYLSLESPRLLVGVTAAEESAAAAESVPRPLTPEDGAELEWIEAEVESRQLYLDPELTLPGLAEQLGLPPRRLSSLVNRGHGSNFSSWINRYRVDEAARRLSDPTAEGENVLEVLYASGFNSKSSFNAAFKRLKGTTPSEFRRATQS